MSHQFGAPDHYHELLTDGSCRGKDICSECGTNKRPTSCLMNNGWIDNIGNKAANTIHCTGCQQDIRTYFNNPQ